MNSVATIRRSIDYIEDHLGEELTLRELASASYYSEYHYHRVFQHFIGESVMSYIRKRRLSKAAELLVNTQRKVLDIALECGFRTPETFSRAFRKMYGIMPRECRSLSSPPFLVPKAMIMNQPTSKGRSELYMQPQIVELPKMHVIGFSITTSTEGGRNRKEIPEFWQQYMNNGWAEQIPGKVNPNVELGVCTAMEKDGSFRYIIGSVVEEAQTVPEGLTGYTIPSTTYAVFTTPPVDVVEKFSPSIHKTWDVIFSEWFPASGYEHAEAPEIEWYDERCHTNTGKQMDIYIPVTKAKY